MADNEARIILTAKDETAQAISSVKSNFLALGQTLSGIDLVKGLGVTAVAAGMIALTKSSIDYMASLHDMSIATGASVESLSAMKTAAKLSGTTLDEAAGAMKKLGISLGEAQLKGGDKAKLFEQLGIDPKTTKDTGLALFDLAKKLDNMPDKFKAMSAARDLLGRSVSMPFLQELAQMESLQAKVTTAQAAAADQFQDNVIRFKAGAGDMGNAIANSVLPGMNEILEFSLKVKKEWGSLAAVIVGLGGGTVLKGLGVELDPLKRAAKESTAAINDLIAARQALADQTASAEARKGQLGPLGQWIIDNKVSGAGAALAAANARSRAALAEEAKLFAEDEKQTYAHYLRKKAAKDLPDAPAKVKTPDRNTALEHMLKVGQNNLNAGLDSEEEQRLLATKREMEDARHEFEALQRMIKVGEDNQLAAYYETAGEEVMRLVGEQRALKASFDESNEFVREAARNIQDALGDGLFDLMQGNFDSIGKGFKTMLDRMVANAIAADLAKRLFGDIGKTGEVGGWAADLLKFFVGKFEMGTPYVPQTGLAIVHQGERIIPAAQNRGGFGGTIIVNVSGTAGQDVRRAAGQGAREALAAFAGAQRYG